VFHSPDVAVGQPRFIGLNRDRRRDRGGRFLLPRKKQDILLRRRADRQPEHGVIAPCFPEHVMRIGDLLIAFLFHAQVAEALPARNRNLKFRRSIFIEIQENRRIVGRCGRSNRSGCDQT